LGLILYYYTFELSPIFFEVFALISGFLYVLYHLLVVKQLFSIINQGGLYFILYLCTLKLSPWIPNSDNSPYTRLKEKHNLTIDFRPFIHVEGVESKEVRQQKIDFNDFEIYVGERSLMDLEAMFKKFKDDRFLLPSSDILKPIIPNFLDSLEINWKRAQLYKTVVSDLSDLRDVYYDVLVFFSPSGIESLFKNFV